MKKITRFEFINKKGRSKVVYGNMYYDIQDNGKTLKVFDLEDIRED